MAELVERWRQGGWSRFDEAAAPSTTGELQSEREAPGSAPGARGGRRVRVYRVEVRRRRIA
ncbi:MAG TPA: hypothetical protein VGD07_04380 [Methylomirabilota bacterium]